MVVMETISHDKAHLRLLELHTRILSQHVIRNQRRMESLHKKVMEEDKNDNEMSALLGEFLGNTQLILNMVY